MVNNPDSLLPLTRFRSKRIILSEYILEFYKLNILELISNSKYRLTNVHINYIWFQEGCTYNWAIEKENNFMICLLILYNPFKRFCIIDSLVPPPFPYSSLCFFTPLLRAYHVLGAALNVRYEENMDTVLAFGKKGLQPGRKCLKALGTMSNVRLQSWEILPCWDHVQQGLNGAHKSWVDRGVMHWEESNPKRQW